jgi:hypothetical protein
MVAVVAVIAYATSLTGTFQFDDLPTVLRNPAIQEPGNLGAFFTDSGLFSGEPGNRMYRPVLLATYLANHVAAGFDPFVWHLTNVLLHAACGLLVVLLARRLFRVFGVTETGLALFLAGLLFALHPVHSEAVNYISARSGVIATAGVLGALLCHLAFRRAESRPGRRGLFLAGSLLLFAAGLGGKEIAVAFVPAVFALELLDPRAGPVARRLRTATLRTLPALLLLAGYLALRSHLLGAAVADVGSRLTSVPGRADPQWGGGRTVLENLLTQARVFWMYLGKLVVPVDLALDRYVEVSRSVLEPRVLLSLAGLLVLLAGIVWAAFRRPVVAFLGLFFLFGLAPTSTIIPLNVLMNEHRLYLPSVGFAILAGMVLARIVARAPRAGTALVGTLGVTALALITLRNFEWKDPHTLWTANLESSPRSFRARNQLGKDAYVRARSIGLSRAALPHLERALHHLTEGVKVYPDWYPLRQNLALAYQLRARILNRDEDFRAAVENLDRCVMLHPEAAALRRDRAVLLAFWGKAEEAHAEFAELAASEGVTAEEKEDSVFRPMLRAMGKDPRAHLGYAKLLARRGREYRAEAERLFERAVELGYPAKEGERESLFE